MGLTELPRNQTRSVFAFLMSELFGGSGRLIIATAVGKQVYDLTHRPLDLGWLGLIEFAPSALLVLVSGTLADRVDKRKMVAWAYLFEAVASIALVANAASNTQSVALIFVAVGVIGIGRAFFQPALGALPAEIVEHEKVPWLMARFSIMWQLSMIAGPVLGGFLYAASSTLPYAVSAVLYVIGAVAVVLVRVTYPSGGAKSVAAEGRGGLHEALEGFRFVRRERVLLGAISLDLFAVLFGGAVALLPAIAEDGLHVGAVGLGWLRAAVGIGGSAMTAVLVVKPIRRHVGRLLFVAVGLFGLFTVVLGATNNFAVAFISIVILSAADAISVFIRMTLVPLITPREKRGRVVALERVFVGASNELGAFESGIAAQILGTAAAVIWGGVATLVVALLWAVLFPALRDQDEFPNADEKMEVGEPELSGLDP